MLYANVFIDNLGDYHVSEWREGIDASINQAKYYLAAYHYKLAYRIRLTRYIDRRDTQEIYYQGYRAGYESRNAGEIWS